MFMDIRSPLPYQARVGIDWADQEHEVFVRFASGDSYRRKIDSRPEAIQGWLLELRSACAEGKIAIALEQRRGALFYHLCTHLNWIDLYPINPHSLASFRKTFFSSRAKDDPVDSQLLEELVRTHSDRLRPYQPESPTERKLDLYCRHRRSLLDLATKTELKLISTLKQYFPLAVNLFAAVGMKSDIALNFLSRWPTLDELRRAKLHTVRSFFYAHNSRSQSLIEKRLQAAVLAEAISQLYGTAHRAWRKDNPQLHFCLCREVAALLKFQEARGIDSFSDAFLEARAFSRACEEGLMEFEEGIGDASALALDRDPATQDFVRNMAFAKWMPAMFSTLSDLQDELHSCSHQRGPHQELCGILASLLRPWLRDGSYGRIVDGPSNIDLGAVDVQENDPLKVVHFELEKIGKAETELRAIVGFLITNAVRNHI
jgi:transposase